MRPLNITMKGFASFASKTEIDLTDVDLFVLEGPTGAGKSSVLDALTFTLYGQAWRYSGRQVAPLLHTGSGQGVVSVDFLAGDQHYRAVRVLRRTSKSVSTKEARLETVAADGSTKVIAASPGGVTERVTEIVGLDFDQFCTVVFLPQGAFSEFLDAKGKDRADLLVDLLGIGVYREMGQAARTRTRAAPVSYTHLTLPTIYSV